MAHGLLIFVSGPSGVGKSTVCRRLVDELPASFALSATTRAGKPQDEFGKPYKFVDQAEFKRLIEARAFLEYAVVFGNMYGTLKQPVCDALTAGQTVLSELDVQGGLQVRNIFADALGIFILPPSLQDLRTRLEARGRDSSATIEQRFAEAQQEIKTAEASNAYNLFVVNQTVGQTVADIKKSIAEFLAKRDRKQ